MGMFVNKRTFKKIKQYDKGVFGGKYYQSDRPVNSLTISFYMKNQKINESQTGNIYSASGRLTEEGDAYRMRALRLNDKS